MATSEEKVLVEWINEDQTGIEPIDCVPENCRHVGVITQVLWTANKKRYPAKIIMISSDLDALESEEGKLLAAKNAALAVGGKRKRQARVLRGSATDAEVNRAIGGKAKVPLHLQTKNTTITKEKRMCVQSTRSVETSLDKSLIERAKRTILFGKDCVDQASPEGEDSADEVCDDSDENTINHENIADDHDNSVKDCLQNCKCQVCILIKKYGNDAVRSFMSALVSLHSPDGAVGIQYLTPLGITSKDKVELTKGKGVFISATDKNRIKVDFSNKPSLMVKETLLAIFGREEYKNVTVTARGNRAGTYGIKPNVLAAVLGFVNRNADKKLTMVDLVTMINKRSADWRSTPRSSGKPKNANVNLDEPPESLPSSEVVDHPDSVQNEIAAAGTARTASRSPPLNFNDVLDLLEPLPSKKTPVKTASETTSTQTPAKNYEKISSNDPMSITNFWQNSPMNQQYPPHPSYWQFPPAYPAHPAYAPNHYPFPPLPPPGNVPPGNIPPFNMYPSSHNSNSGTQVSQ